MTTTHLFVELLVVGLGALVWLFLLGAGLFGYDLGVAFEGKWLSLETIFPLLTVAYLFGILIDRFADWLFHWWDARHLRDVFGRFHDPKKAYFRLRRTLIVDAPDLWQHLEYGRSRLRICRGWAVNALLIAATLTYDWAMGADAMSSLAVERLIGCDLLLLLLAISCVLAWRELNRKEYRKIERQASWLLGRSSRRRPRRRSSSRALSPTRPSDPMHSTDDEEGPLAHVRDHESI